MKGGNMKRVFDTVIGFACLVLAVVILAVAITACEPVDIPNYDIITGWEV
jgi:hypothetical protein